MPADVGSIGIQLRIEHACDYIITPMLSTNQGWHARWFYIKIKYRYPFPAYTVHVIGEPTQHWKWGASKEVRKSMDEAVTAIKHIRELNVNGAVVVGSYHQQWYAPLMARSCPMYMTMLELRVIGDMVMAPGASDWVMPNHPVMLPNASVIDLVCHRFISWFSSTLSTGFI